MFESLAATAPLSVEVFYGIRGLFALLVAALVLVFRMPASETLRVLDYPLAVIMCLAPFLTFLPADGMQMPLAIAAAVLGGLALIWNYLQCIRVYSRLKPRDVVVYVLVSFVLASVLRYPLEFLPNIVALVLVSPLPFVCTWMCRRALAGLDTPTQVQAWSAGAGKAIVGTAVAKAVSATESRLEPMLIRRLLPVAVELAIYGVVVGLVRLSAEGEQYQLVITTIHLSFRVVFSILVFFVVLSGRGQARISLLTQISLLFVITALVAISIFGGPSSIVAIVASTCARSAIIILLWLVLALMASRDRRHPYVVFGIGWSLYMLSISAGMILGDYLGVPQVLSDSFLLNLIYFLIVSTVFILSLRGGVSQQLLDEDETRNKEKGFVGGGGLQELLDIDGRCAAIGEARSLTRREVEVMQQMCRGRSKSYIAKSMVVSENTIRGYSKNLYSKLGIHSRQELMDLVGIGSL